MKQVKVRSILSTGGILCSDGRMRSAASYCRVREGMRVWVDGDFILGHEWRKVKALFPPRAKVEKLTPCPQNYVLLLLRADNGVRKYYCLSLADGAAQALKDLNDSRIDAALRGKLYDVEEKLGIAPPASQHFHVHEKDDKYFFLLGKPFYRSLNYTIEWLGFVYTVKILSEQRPYFQDATGGVSASPPWPDIHLFSLRDRLPAQGQSQSHTLNATAIDSVSFGADSIEVVGSEFKAFTIEDDYYPHVVHVNGASWKKYDYAGALLDAGDAEAAVAEYFPDYPGVFTNAPPWNTAANTWQIIGMRRIAAAVYEIYVLQTQHIIYPWNVDCHKLRWEPGSTPSFVDTVSHYTVNDDGSFSFRVSDDLALSGDRALSGDWVTINGVVGIWQEDIEDEVFLQWQTLSAQTSGSLTWVNKVYDTRGIRPAAAALAPVAWLAEAGHKVLVYSEVVATGFDYDAGINGLTEWVWTEYTTRSRWYLNINGTAVQVETIESTRTIIRSSEEKGGVESFGSGWSCSGEEVRDVSLSIWNGKLLVSYLVFAVTKPAPKRNDNGRVIEDYPYQEEASRRVFAFYDLASKELIWSGSIAGLPLSRFTAGFMSPEE